MTHQATSPDPAEEPTFLDELPETGPLPTSTTLATTRDILGARPGETIEETLERRSKDD